MWTTPSCLGWFLRKPELVYSNGHWVCPLSYVAIFTSFLLILQNNIHSCWFSFCSFFCQQMQFNVGERRGLDSHRKKLTLISDISCLFTFITLLMIFIRLNQPSSKKDESTLWLHFLQNVFAVAVHLYRNTSGRRLVCIILHLHVVCVCPFYLLWVMGFDISTFHFYSPSYKIFRISM